MSSTNKITYLSKITAVLPPLVALAALMLVIVPVNSVIIDLLLSLSFVFAISVFVMTLLLRDLRELSSFPSILLFGTVFRLALNVATTRLILLNGGESLEAAGQVVRSFGEFVVRGDFAVGLIVYVVIATVNFLVIAKGSTRVAEVSARFSLDALPGRQLAIDAELRSGKISSTEADERRAKLNSETKFFGAMDGAMRFVQGDAIAGIIIVLINALGGIAIGVSRGLEFSLAASNFGVLAVGDGLVNIIPSIMFSAAAGVLVTQVSRDKAVGIGEEVVSQLFGKRSTLLYSGIFLLLLGSIPGFPKLAFLLIGSLMCALAWLPSLLNSRGKVIPKDKVAELLRIDGDIHNRFLAKSDKVPARIVIKADIGSKDGFLKIFAEHFRSCFAQTGVCPPLPQIDIINEVDAVGRLEYFIGSAKSVPRKIPLGSRFVEGTPASIQLFAGTSSDRIVNEYSLKSGCWIPTGSIRLNMAGSLDLRVLDLAEFVVESYFSFCLEHPEYSIDVDYVSMLISCQREKTPELVSELFDRGLISRAEYAEILKGLILARIGISDQLIIMDRTLAANRSLDPSLNRSELIQEILRELKRSLNPAVFRDAVSPLRLFYIGTDIEEELQGTLSPRARTIITESLHKLVETMVDKGSTPVTLACSDEVVDQLTSLTEDTPGLRGRTRVFGYRQLASYKHVERLGLVQM
jgi:type III secretory pathway component EscV